MWRVSFGEAVRWLALGLALLLTGCTVKFILIERVDVSPVLNVPATSQPKG